MICFRKEIELFAYKLIVLNLEFIFIVKKLTLCKLESLLKSKISFKNPCLFNLYVILLTFRLRCNFNTFICNEKIFRMFF